MEGVWVGGGAGKGELDWAELLPAADVGLLPV